MATLLESPTHLPPRFALDATADTFPKLLRRNAGLFDDRIAFREKDMGVWRPITWREYYRHARAFGLGLVALGLRQAQILALVGDNPPQLFYAALGAPRVGALTHGVDPGNPAGQLKHPAGFS